MLFFCAVSFSQFFADTMLVVEQNDSLPQDEHIKRSVENRGFKTRGLANVIALESGIQKDRNGAVGGFESFSIRGISGGRIGVFVNGNSVANAGGALVDLSRYDGLNVQQIDIYRNFLPAELGGNLFGGAVNIITESRENYDFSSQIFLLCGSFGEIRTFANLNHIPISKKTKISLFADLHKAENNFRYMDYNGTFYGKDHELDDSVRSMDNNRFNALTFSGNVKNSQKKFDIDGNFSVFASKYEIPSPAGVIYKYRNRSAFDANREYLFSLSQNFHNAGESKIKVFYLLSHDEFNWTDKDNIAFPYSLLPKDGKGTVASKNNALDGSFLHKFRFGDNFCLSVNTSLRGEKINYSNDVTSFEIEDREVDRLNAAVGGDLKIITRAPEIIFGASIRGYGDKTNNWKEGFIYKDVPDTALFDIDNTLRLSVNNYFLSAPVQISADIVYAEKIPNLRQRYGYYGVIPNANLLSEKVYSAQVVLIADYPVKTITSVFANYCENLIRIIYFSNVGKAVNISKTSNYGIENDVSWKISSKVELSNNATLQMPLNLSEKSDKNLYVPNESVLKINTEMKIGDFGGLSFIAQYSYKSPYFHDLYNIYRVPFDENKKGLSFFSFVLQYKVKFITAQAGIYDISSSGNSPQKISALESGYFPIIYPGMSVKSSVLLDLKGFGK
jgi:hypothetical protein